MAGLLLHSRREAEYSVAERMEDRLSRCMLDGGSIALSTAQNCRSDCASAASRSHAFGAFNVAGSQVFVHVRRHGDPDAFIRSHIRRLEALRRAGHVERIDADHWKVPEDIAERGMAYDAPSRSKDFAIRTLSALDLERQIGSDGATWLDWELVADKRIPLGELGFGREVKDALHRRPERLVEMGLATDNGKSIIIPRGTIGALERQEVERVGKQMAAKRGLTYAPSGPGEYVSGRLAGVANLTSGRFAMIEDGLGFQLVPWQPVLEKRIDQYISGVRRDDGGIEWGFGRKRQIGLGL
jgi:Protein of unknown function (DUF3363)